MKNLVFSLLILAASLLFPAGASAQDEDQAYVIVEYMKVKPDMGAKYEQCEAVWKKIHEARKKAGFITGWELEQVLYPGGTHTEYDYLTLTHVSNWQGIEDLAKTWNEATWKMITKGLTKEETALADQADQFRDIVKREIWAGMDMISDGKRATFIVENYMRLPANGWDAWYEMETEFVKPVHQKTIDMGMRAGWLMGAMVLPRGDDQPYQVSTLDLYHNWADMNKSTEAAWEAVYPNMTEAEMNNRVEGKRTIARTEVRMLADYIE